MAGRPSTQEEFLTKARRTYGDKYSYAKTVYVRSTVKVVITCPHHRDFLQTPQSQERVQPSSHQVHRKRGKVLRCKGPRTRRMEAKTK